MLLSGLCLLKETLQIPYVNCLLLKLSFFFIQITPYKASEATVSVRGYSSLLVATAEAEATTRTGRQHTHAHAHTTPTQPCITSKHDMKSLLVREQVDGSTVLSTKTKYIQGHSTKLLLSLVVSSEIHFLALIKLYHLL